MSNDYTLVNFGAMKEAQASFNKALGEYKAALSDLQGKVQSTLAEWEGDADEAYRAMQKQWNAAGDQLGQVVHNMGQAIGDSHDGYLTTERRNTAMFGG